MVEVILHLSSILRSIHIHVSVQGWYGTSYITINIELLLVIKGVIDKTRNNTNFYSWR